MPLLAGVSSCRIGLLDRRLPAFLIATVDKFAGLPFVDKVGAFLDHVDREDEQGFYGAAEPGVGRKLFGGHDFCLRLLLSRRNFI
jgi:hypothetical protein